MFSRENLTNLSDEQVQNLWKNFMGQIDVQVLECYLNCVMAPGDEALATKFAALSDQKKRAEEEYKKWRSETPSQT